MPAAANLSPLPGEKKSVEDQQRFYDQDGNQIKFGIGKTYICVVDKARNITMDEVVQPKPADANEATPRWIPWPRSTDETNPQTAYTVK